MKLKQYLTECPSHFNNLFLKSFRLLQNLMRNCTILQQLIRFHETNDISQNFSGITLGFHETSKYFVDFQFHFKYLRKITPKFQLLSNRFKISKFCTFQWRKLKSQYRSYLVVLCGQISVKIFCSVDRISVSLWASTLKLFICSNLKEQS